MQKKHVGQFPLSRISAFLEAAIRDTGRDVQVVGRSLAVSAAATPDGGLPIFHCYAEKVDRLLNDGENVWLSLLKGKEDENSLTGAALYCDDDLASKSDTAWFPVVSLYYQALMAAIEMTEDPTIIELSHLIQEPIKSEVLHELSSDRWSSVHSTSGEEQPELR